MENHDKYTFLNQIAVGMVSSIDKAMLEANIERLSRLDEKGTSVFPQLMPDDSEFMCFYLLYLLLTKISKNCIQQLVLQNPEAAETLIEKLALLSNCLENGDKPLSIGDFAKILSQDAIPAFSSSLSGGFDGGAGESLPVPVIKLNFFCGLLSDILFPATADNKVQTLPDMCSVAISALNDTIKSSKLAVLPTKPTITDRGSHLEFPI
jgi:hypothetical protein